ncbi:MAG: GDP-L-fucose synthase [Bacteriovoracaceae bacterium]|jgi:GDP-L-fucose synthase|nr:GDP-L-fucose synthase [Bacteriovoracaceae bacterium]
MKPSDKIYVAGHRGLLGSAIVKQLKAKGFTNIICKTSAELDLRDEKSVSDFISSERPEYVILTAAKVGGIQANINSPAEFFYDNIKIQNNVIHHSYKSGVKKLLFVGSSCIYPKEVENPIKEEYLFTGPLEPTNEAYALAKVSGIKMCQYYRTQYGVNFISAIPTNLYGVNDSYDPIKSHLLPALIRKVHQAKKEGEKEIEIWGSGRPRREFMLADDCANALVFLLQNYNELEPINVGTGVDHSVMELAQKVSQVLEYPVKICNDPSKPDGILRKNIDVTKLEALGWKSNYTLEEGVKIAYLDFLDRDLG